MRFPLGVGVTLMFVLAGCGAASGDVEGDLYRFGAGESVAIEPVDGSGLTIVVAFDYLAAEFLPDVSPSEFVCSLSDGLSAFSIERSTVNEQTVGGKKVTPILTIRAFGESGLLECQNVFLPGGDGLNSLRAVVFSPSAD